MKTHTSLYKLFLLLSAALLLFFFAAGPGAPAVRAQGLSVSPSPLEWSAGDTSPKEVTIQCSGAWSADSLLYGGVFRLSGQSGYGNTVVTVTPQSQNPSVADRSALVAFSGSGGSGSVYLVQHGIPVVLTASPESLGWTASQTTAKTVSVQCNTTWSAAVQGSGFSTYGSGGTGNGSVAVYPDGPNYDPDGRTAVLVLSAGSVTVRIDLSQEPASWTGDLATGRSYIQRTTFTSSDCSAFTRDVTWYDGLGYPDQETLVAAAPGGTKSIVTPVVYDRMRRADARIYLPYAVATPTGVHDSGALTHQVSFYAAAPYLDTRPFADKVYETSPAGRPLSLQREGEAWDDDGGHRSAFAYRMNTAADSIPRYRILPGTGKAEFLGLWPAGMLACTQTTDEEGSVSRSFTDGFGKTVLAETETGTTLPGGAKEKARTLYVYDLRDSLAVVVQPEGVKALEPFPATQSSSKDLSLTPGSATDNGTVTDRWCFVRTYDGRGNVLSEHVPGGGTSQYAYDARNRVVLRTDERMSPPASPSVRRMVLTLHDAFDRIVEERYVSSPNSTFSALRSFFRDTVTHTMAASALTTMLPTLQTLRSATYFPFNFSPSGYPSSGDAAFVPEAGIVGATDLETARVKGFLRQETVCPAPAVDGSVRSGAPSVTRYYHYDAKGRVIQVNECWSDGRRHRVSTKYAFAGDVLAVKETVLTPPPGGSGSNQENSLATFYTRDPRGRVLSCSRVLDGTDTLAAVHYAYDDLGRLTGKTVGDGTTPALQTTLSYDLHGWTKGIGVARDGGANTLESVFSESLSYAMVSKDFTAARYDGNISETAFTHRVTPSGSLQKHTWSYHYDGLKRLSTTNHYVANKIRPSLTDTEKNFAYDLNGNITALKRYGASGLENDLSFTHTGNRMTALVDAAATGSAAGTKAFSYDANGNLVSDGRKGLQMSWNLLNLANSAAMYGGSLTYVWLSDGTKVGAKADDGSGNGTQKRYLGSYVFTSTDGSSTAAPTAVESIAWDEGRINCGGSAAQDCWFAGDHLGNVRSVIDITASLTTPQILEQNDYLPYGTKVQNPDHASQSGNRWRYASKEEQRYGSLDLSLLDFGARMYDPFIARWTAVDPLASIHPEIASFIYCFGNPIMFFDPQGLDGYSGSNGEYVWFDKKDVESFSDINHIEWKRVTSNKHNWDEAMIIRKANIEALVSLGFDRVQSSQDVKLFDESSSVFTKESRLLNPEHYTATWEPSLNSATMKTDALTSNEVDSSGYRLKFYSTKGSDSSANSLGLIKAGRFEHKVEAAIEAIERIIFSNKADNDPVYDMHVKNARGFLNRSKE